MLHEQEHGKPGHYWRPATRGDCFRVPRPCPYVGCCYHLYLDVSPRTGSIKLNFPDLEPGELPPACSCALDVAERGAHTLEQVGDLLNVTRERARQLELIIFRKLAARGHMDHLRELWSEGETTPVDERLPHKLTDRQAAGIIRLHRDGLSRDEIADLYGVHVETVGKTIRRAG